MCEVKYFNSLSFQNGHQSNHQTTSEDRTDLNDGTETNKNKREERKNKNKKKRETSDENSEEQNGENTDEKQTRKKRKREQKEQNGQNKDEESSKKQKKRKQEAFDGKDRISRTDAVSAFDRSLTSCVFDQSESLNPEEEEPENQDSESNSTGISASQCLISARNNYDYTDCSTAVLHLN